MLNRNAGTANIRLHVVQAGGSADTTNAIEWDKPLAGLGVLERWAITIGNGQKIVARSSLTGVNVVTWGA